MKYNFEFTASESRYYLMCNNASVRVWAKSRHSKQEAEEKASDVVSKAMRKHGMSNVNYNGNIAV